MEKKVFNYQNSWCKPSPNQEMGGSQISMNCFPGTLYLIYFPKDFPKETMFKKINYNNQRK